MHTSKGNSGITCKNHIIAPMLSKNDDSPYYRNTMNNNHVDECIAPEIVGLSSEIQGVKLRISQFARLDNPVLISGESGTGKELVAKAIHTNSTRSKGPFIAINCGGLPTSLIESELFGHTQGSFTGAFKTKNGLVDAADGGTLFLDEIGELPLSSQSVLLRMLDSGEYYRIGETTPHKADVRIVSATNRCLQTMTQEGTFRSDLFYRLKGVHISLPPLRLRKSDIPALISYFLDKSCTVSASAMRMLQSMDWPGNIRELKMTISSLAGICRNDQITDQDISAILSNNFENTTSSSIPSFHLEKEATIAKFEQTYLTRLIGLSNGNLSKAATIAGLTRKHLRSLLKKANLYSMPEI